jgi:hypothetical protein
MYGSHSYVAGKLDITAYCNVLFGSVSLQRLCKLVLQTSHNFQISVVGLIFIAK